MYFLTLIQKTRKDVYIYAVFLKNFIIAWRDNDFFANVLAIFCNYNL